MYRQKIGVYGNGSFATAIANKLALNNSVLVYAYRPETALEANKTRVCKGQPLHNNISFTNDIHYFLNSSTLIFVIVPSMHLKNTADNLTNKIDKSKHIVSHGIKSVFFEKNTFATASEYLNGFLNLDEIFVISGPNLAKEMSMDQPSSIVVAGKNTEKRALICSAINSPLLNAKEYESSKSVEICSSLKNIYAILMGIVKGSGFLLNVQGNIFSLFVREMRTIIKDLNLDENAILLPSGIGDLFTTCMSENSRNYSLGYKISQGFSIESLSTSDMQAYEGLRSLKNFKLYFDQRKTIFDLIDLTYKLVFEKEKLATVISRILK